MLNSNSININTIVGAAQKSLRSCVFVRYSGLSFNSLFDLRRHLVKDTANPLTVPVANIIVTHFVLKEKAWGKLITKYIGNRTL